MVNASLIGAHPLRNSEGDDASHLAELFHFLLEHYTLNSSPMVTVFIQALRTLVGLGFTACLANGGHIACYQPYLNCFLKKDSGDFRRHPDSLMLLSQAIANMIMLAVGSFRFLSNANYHAEFMTILKNTLDNVVIKTNEKSEAVKKRLG